MKEKKDRRIAMMIEPTLVNKIDTFRFSNRIGSQAEAMRKLIKIGLENEVATTGVEFGDTAPADAEQNNTHKESCSATST